ncbi:MAG: hypothetical protein ACMUEM_00720 [Flavobacteriales bacterium AspAUS03]
MKKWIIILSMDIFLYACTQNPEGNKAIYLVDEVEGRGTQEKTNIK